MRPTDIYEAAKAVNGKVTILGDVRDVKITGAERDNRVLEPGDIFVCIKGEKVDGHSFIAKAFENGASAALCTHIPEDVKEGAFIVVEDTVKALQDLAEWYRQTLDVKVVGISGSVGKTSTKEMMAAVLSEKFHVLKTKGNLNNEIGLPIMVLRINPEHEVVVLEMGISDFGEMRLLARIARPNICVLTNIGQSHLENLGTRDGIMKAKTEMFEYRDPEGPIFLNGDDDKLSTISDVAGTKPVFFGFSSSHYAHPENVRSLGLRGTEMTVCLGDRKFDASIRMIGNHNVANAMAASAVGEYLGMTDEELVRGLASAETIKGRSNLIPHGKGFILDDCYNAAPNSMRAAIDTLCLAEGKRIAILGDMFELGSDEKTMHEEIGTYIAGKPVDLLLTVGDLAKNYDKGAKEAKAFFEVVHFDTMEECKASMAKWIGPDDNVLVKASNGMHFSELVDQLQ